MFPFLLLTIMEVALGEIDRRSGLHSDRFLIKAGLVNFQVQLLFSDVN